MGYCELCGKQDNHLKKAKILGSEMYVCNNCLSFGKEVKNENKNLSFRFRKKVRRGEDDFIISKDSVNRIKSEMNKRDLNVKKLSKAINVKESTLSKILNNKLDLDIELAKKIEKFLELKLIENAVNNLDLDDYFTNDNEEEGGYTLGDLIKK